MSDGRNNYEFDGFTFDPRDQVLFRGGDIIALPPKTCELLSVLLANSGRIVSKRDLMEQVWPNTFVEEANLSHHITVLRKAIGGELIETIPRKGYRLTLPMEVEIPRDREVTLVERQTSEIVEEIEIDDGAARALPPARRSGWPIAVMVILLAVLSVTGYLLLTRSASTPAVVQPLVQTILTNNGRLGASSISPDGKLVAYVQNYTDGIGILYVRQTETNIENILATYEKGEFGMTAFSPDGAFVIYAVRTADHPAFSLYRTSSIGGGTPVKLIDELPANRWALSPDGAEIAAVRNDDQAKTSSLVGIRTDGTAIERTIATRSQSELFFGPGGGWSPDGKKLAVPIAWAGKSDNYTRSVVNVGLVDLASGRVDNLSHDTWVEVGLMRWMPDSSGVVVIGSRPQLRNQIYFVASPSGEVSRITNDNQSYGNYGLGITKDGKSLVADVWDADERIWRLDANGNGKSAVRFAGGYPNTIAGLAELPDGRVIYAARNNFTYDLWLANEKETDAKPMTTDAFIDTYMSSSSDGKFLVVASDRAGPGTKHIFRMNTDGSDVRQLTFGDGFEDAPDLSPDGKWILFQVNSFDATSGVFTGSIQKIPAIGGDITKVIDGCFVPSFSPDGKQFSCVAPEDNYHGRIVVGNIDGELQTKDVNADFFFQTQNPARWTPDGKAVVVRRVENQVGSLWQYPIAGGPPTKLVGLDSELVFNYVFSRDAKHLLLTRGNSRVNVVMFTNFKQH